MSLKPQKPLPGQQVKVDISKADTIKCEYCGNYLFIQSTILKKLSPSCITYCAKKIFNTS